VTEELKAGGMDDACEWWLVITSGDKWMKKTRGASSTGLLQATGSSCHPTSTVKALKRIRGIDPDHGESPTGRVLSSSTNSLVKQGLFCFSRLSNTSALISGYWTTRGYSNSQTG